LLAVSIITLIYLLIKGGNRIKFSELEKQMKNKDKKNKNKNKEILETEDIESTGRKESLISLDTD
jgi:hypothetical protein